MLMLIKILGSDYIVWDRSAKIIFKQPGTETLYADFVVTRNDVDEIRTVLEEQKSFNKIYNLIIRNAEGKTHAEVEKVLYIAKKREKIL
jgi:hypothetical protein